MARFNFNSVRNIASTRDSVAWGKINFEQKSTLIFAALLVVCSLAVGCSSEKPKTENTGSQPVVQNTPPITAPVMPVVTTSAETTPKPAPKKAVRKTPITVKYIDKTFGVSFRYPRKYGLKTGDSANELVSEASMPMSFTQPGGVAIAAVAVPEGAYPKSDLAAAWFDASVNKSLTAEQCAEFSDGTTTPSPAPVADGTTNATTTPAPAPAVPAPTPGSKLMLGDMELKSLETLASVGTGKEASKYYHVFQNGACYEFALKVATTGESDEGGKPVDRGDVFKRLEKILATVKIDTVKIDTVKIDAVTAPEVTATAPAAPATPAQ
jgi:hypothetical protein